MKNEIEESFSFLALSVALEFLIPSGFFHLLSEETGPEFFTLSYSVDALSTKYAVNFLGEALWANGVQSFTFVDMSYFTFRHILVKFSVVKFYSMEL